MHDPVVVERRVEMKLIDVFVLQGCGQCLAGLDKLRDIALSYKVEVVQWNERYLLAHIRLLR